MENTDYKYQQGMNDVLGVIISALSSEYFILQELTSEYESDGRKNSDECSASEAASMKIFKMLHDPKGLWADAFTLFEKVMNLGIKELYYKELEDDMGIS